MQSTIDSIANNNNSATGAQVPTQNAALTNAISMDLIHEIHRKCDEIEKKVDILSENAVLNIMNEHETSIIVEHSVNVRDIPAPQPSHTVHIQNDTSQVEICGTSSGTIATSSNVLASTILPSHFHLSNLATNISSHDLLQYILDKTGLSTEKIRVIRLTKKNQDLSLLNFINFKIETTSEMGDLICAPEFFPKSSKIVPFARKSVGRLSQGSQVHGSSPVPLASLSFHSSTNSEQNFQFGRTVSQTT